MNILFICTHNRCRSILCEALMNHLSDGRIRAYSAGSQPSGQVHRRTLEHLEKRGISTTNLRSKSWDELAQSAPDVVITVCDSAANETCPTWFGPCIKTHWGLPDPSITTGSTNQIDLAFDNCIDVIQKRINKLLSEDIKQLSRDQIILKLNQIGTEHNHGLV